MSSSHAPAGATAHERGRRALAVSALLLSGCAGLIGADFDDAEKAPPAAADNGGSSAGTGGSSAGVGGKASGNGGSGGASGKTTTGGAGGAKAGAAGSEMAGAAGANAGAAGSRLGPGGAAGSVAGAAGSSSGAAGSESAGTSGAAGTSGDAGTSGAAGSAAGVGGDGGTSGAAGRGGDAGAAGTGPSKPSCPVGPAGAPMVALPRGDKQGFHCVDATEVTRTQYEAFLTAGAAPNYMAPEVCFTNDIAPIANCVTRIDVCQTGCADHPQVCVDYCDAHAFCAWSGKRLCGDLGGTPGVLGEGQKSDDPTVSEWMSACTSGGKYVDTQFGSYVYGLDYKADACNTTTESQEAVLTAPVKSFPKCQSPSPDFQGVFDLNGNVLEWEDRCITSGGTTSCRIRGGGASSGKSSTCYQTGDRPIDETNLPNVGIRCCADPL